MLCDAARVDAYFGNHDSGVLEIIIPRVALPTVERRTAAVGRRYTHLIKTHSREEQPKQ